MKNSNYVIRNDKEYLDKYVKAAKEYKQSKKLVSIRLAKHDIDKVKKMAEEE
jgi:predicted DNA binding CopG/RHH family protein